MKKLPTDVHLSALRPKHSWSDGPLTPPPRTNAQRGLGILLLASPKAGAAGDQRRGCRCHPHCDRRLTIQLEPPPGGVAEGMGSRAGLATTSGLCSLFRSAPSLLPAPARQPFGFPRNGVVGPSRGVTSGRGPVLRTWLAQSMLSGGKARDFSWRRLGTLTLLLRPAVLPCGQRVGWRRETFPPALRGCPGS